MAGLNAIAAARAERRHPPPGRFLDVGGVRLHYTDRGRGRPVVLLHGNAVSGQDFVTSGVADRLALTNRVVIIDRPGFGYSERPRGPAWTPSQQADLLHQALEALGVGPAVVVGHSWGTLAALALALDHPSSTSGLVLLSGYYFPTLRLDAPLVAPAAMPVLGDVLRYTTSPVLGRLLMPAFKRLLFAPADRTARFEAEYSESMALRPSQIRATAMDGAIMVPSVRRFRRRLRELAVPVAILAGRGDKVVGRRQPRRLHDAIPGSTLQLIEGAGHMVHHVATEAVVDAIRAVLRRSDERIGASSGGAEPLPKAA